MTPFQLASDMFRTGISHDEVVSRLVATGLNPDDASTAALAARHHQQPAPTTAEAPVKPGFHGWLLLATIVHAIYAAVTVSGLALSAIALAWLARRLDTDKVQLAVLSLGVFAVAAVLLVSGLVQLFRRKRAARALLIAWNLTCFAVALVSFVFGEGGLRAMIIPLAWVYYFSASKQLRATLTE